MKRFLSVLLLLVSLGAFSTANAGVPVVDGTHIGTTLMNWMKQFQNWQDQVKRWTTETQQWTQQMKTVTDVRNLGIPEIEELQKFVDRNQLMSRQLSDGFRTLSSDASKIKNNLMVFDRCASLADVQKDLCTKQINSLATNMADMNSALEKIQKRMDTIRSLGNKVKATTDIKESSDLTARIAKEQAELQNTSQELQIQMQMAQLQQLMLAEQQEQAYRKDFSSKEATRIEPIKW